MRRQAKLTPEQESEIVAWWLARQMSVADKAASYGISTGTLQNILSRHGVSRQSYKDKMIKRYMAALPYEADR